MTAMRSAPPKLYEHVCRVFAAMKSDAIPVNIPDGGDQRHAFIWEGHTTKLFRQLELPTPYYTSCLNRLEQMNCIKQLSRGGGSAASRWELLDDPDIDVFMRVAKAQKVRGTRLGALEQRFLEINKRLQAVEAKLERLEATG